MRVFFIKRTMLALSQLKSFALAFSKARGFLRQSLKSTSAEVETSLALQAGGAPADRLEGVKPPLAGGFLFGPVMDGSRRADRKSPGGTFARPWGAQARGSASRLGQLPAANAETPITSITASLSVQRSFADAQDDTGGHHPLRVVFFLAL